MSKEQNQVPDTTEDFLRIGNNVLDEATFYEVKQYLYPIVKRRGIMIGSIIAVVVGFILFLMHKQVIGIVLVVFGVMFLMDSLTVKNKAARRAVEQIKHATGKDHCTYTYTFSDTEVQVRCVETGMTEQIPFEVLTRRAETKNTVVLFTKQSRMVIIRKNAIGAQKMEKLLKYLDEKCVNMQEVNA